MKAWTQHPFFSLWIALLPISGELLHWKTGGRVVSLAALGFWVTALLFRYLSRFLPSGYEGLARVLWLAGLGQIAYDFLGLQPLWILSVLVLSHEAIKRGSPEDSRSTFMKGILKLGTGFWGLGLYLGGAQEILGQHYRIGIFTQPFGTLWLVSLAAFLWQNQPNLARSLEKNRNTTP